tara:strand:+ start:163 stop:426 length:264 start_codon:yes stop_codon:yes gene_type:complete
VGFSTRRPLTNEEGRESPRGGAVASAASASETCESASGEELSWRMRFVLAVELNNFPTVGFVSLSSGESENVTAEVKWSGFLMFRQS